MRFDYRHFFMGMKFAVFNYATKRSGGFVYMGRFDYWNKDKIYEQNP